MKHIELPDSSIVNPKRTQKRESNILAISVLYLYSIYFTFLSREIPDPNKWASDHRVFTF